MNKTYRRIAALVLVILPLIISSCAEGPSKAEVLPISILLECSVDEKDFIAEMVRRFNETPGNDDINIELMVTGIKSTTGTTKITADVYSVNNDKVYNLAKDGRISSVKSYTHGADRDVIDITAKTSLYKKTAYSFPYAVEACILYYNKSLVSGDDIESFEKLITAAASNGRKIGADISNALYSTGFYLTAGCSIFGADGTKSSELTLDSDQGIKATEYIGALKQKGVLNLRYEKALPLLESGELVAYLGDYIYAGKFKETLGENFAAAVLPTVKINGSSENLMSLVTVKHYVVNRNSKYSLEAMMLADFLSSAETQKARYEYFGSCPISNELLEWDTITNDAAAQALYEQLAYAAAIPSAPEMDSFWNYMNPFLSEVYEGYIKSSEYKTALDELHDNILK